YPFYFLSALLALRLLPVYGDLPTISLILIYNSALLAVCMICHGELARLKPDVEHLTSFYLLVSAGGALGSAAVVIVAPQIFDRYWEFQIAVVGAGLLAALCTIRDRASWFYRWSYGRLWCGAAILTLIACSAYFTYQLLNRDGDIDVFVTRNFFGVKTITRSDEELQLAHGNTEHGMQYQVPEARKTPTLYYARDSGVGLYLDHYQRPAGRPLRLGVIGMGAGTLAAYGKMGDYFRFYEIDPAVPRFSDGTNPFFTFVGDSAAHTDVVLGDARIKMQDEIVHGQLQDFDVLVVDAFSGDSIPVHLLTREAIELYLRELHGPQSLLAIHVSSRSLALAPVVTQLAEYFHLASIEIDTTTSRWVLLSRDEAVLRAPELTDAGHAIEVTRPLRLWTDEYSSVLDVLRW
ncbi:MAG TPA: hypothetical protein VMH04_17200, partial [Candidatus Solibacter sp.]|nr:hypothetical protein [Candidatus Solibacter sp.]